MIELLSLPRGTNQNMSLPNIKLRSGLPINSLPGWEHIPLALKLPMLKCPGNQVIFSQNKIGQMVNMKKNSNKNGDIVLQITNINSKIMKHEFDTSVRDSIPQYNPLHDPNLKTFYANERNLKRLRENGEITLENDVICNLKDFNQYRQQLHKSQLYFILQERNRLESEQRDSLLIANAERNTNRDHQNVSARDHSHSKIVYRKSCLDQQRAEYYRRMYENTLKKFDYIQIKHTNTQTSLEQKKVLRQLKRQRLINVRNELRRKQLISLKKSFKFKKERLHKNMQKLCSARLQNQQEKQIKSWNKRLAERIAHQEKVDKLLHHVSNERKIFIENHKRTYQKKWDKIQEGIVKRKLENRKKINSNNESKEMKDKRPKNPFSVASFNVGFEELLDSEVFEALNIALDLQDKFKVPFEADDPIYKAAQYIMEVILKNYHKDLSQDKVIHKNVYERMDKFFDETKRSVTIRATQIISSLQEHTGTTKSTNCKRNSAVSFIQLPNTIGMSSYKIHPLIKVKEVFNRQPTPAGSLTSIIVNSTTSLVEKSNCSNLSRNDLVFIEHYIAKFKRKLTVGIGHKVFEAIQCHYANIFIGVKQDLLDIDRKFLLNQVAKSILGYAVNPLNFESIIKLCSSALASDIIWCLQKQLLKIKPVRGSEFKHSITSM